MKINEIFESYNDEESATFGSSVKAWKKVFDKLNADGDNFIPFTDIEYYTNAIITDIDNEGIEITPDVESYAEEIAKKLADFD